MRRREKSRDSGRDRGEIALEDGERREREKLLTHNTIRRLRLLRWILKDPGDYYFFVFFHFHSSIIISEERIDARSRPSPRGCVRSPHVCTAVVRVYVYTRVHAYVCVRSVPG